MALRVLALLVSNASVTLASWTLVRRLKRSRSELDAALVILVRLIFISATVLLLASLGIFFAWVVVILGAVVLAGLCRAGEHKTLPRVRPGALGRAGLIVAGVLLARLLAQVWFFAPYLTDVLSYHLPKVSEWVRTGTLWVDLGLDNHAPFPAGFELVEAWWMIFLHHDAVVEMAGVEFLALAFASVYGMARRLELSARASGWAALLYALTPGLYLQATACMNDGPVAAVFVAGTALAVAREPVALVLCAVGLGTGIKATFAFALPGLALLFLARRRALPSRAPSCPLAKGMAVLALLTGFFWYARNAVQYGNPAYPAGTGALLIQQGPRWSSLGTNFAGLFGERLADSRAPYGPLLDGICGWGAVGVGGGLLSLAVMMRRDVRFLELAGAYLSSVVSVLLLVSHDDWYARFVLFFPAILVIAFVRVLRDRPELVWIAVVAGAAEFAGTMLPYDLPWKDFRLLARQGVYERSVAPIVRADVPGKTVGYIAVNRGPAYCLYRPDLSRGVVYLRGRTVESLREEIRKSGVDVIFIASLPEELRPVVEQMARSGLLVAGGPRWYRVAPEGF